MLAVLAANPMAAMAWDQAPTNQTHQAINGEAVDKFLQTQAQSGKYKDSPVDLEKTYFGPRVVSYGSLISTYHLDSTRALTFKEWLIHGGYSADEPHLYASVRHFYNPLPEVGPPQLTDHSEAWGTVENELELHATSARDWAFTNAENSFCWENALKYYKQAMELPDDSQITEVPGFSFRDETIPVESPADVRNVYLAKAFRGLGETMHLMADMTQPAHVRNDSHPVDEPLEGSVSKTNVMLARYFQAEPGVGSQIDSADSAENVFANVALFTNKNFYSSDTIYDQASGILPRNGEYKFPSPQFKDMVLLKTKTTPAGVPISGIAYGKNFKNRYFENSNLIPMVQQSYSSYILGQKGYCVPYSFALEQSAVLLPIAIKANARLIDLFFPTMELKIGVQKLPATSEKSQEFQLKSEMKHLVQMDGDWKKYGLEIKYSGPAELWCVRNGQDVKLAEISFLNGVPRSTVIVYTGDSKNDGGQDVVRCRVFNKDILYIVIKAGGRTFKSDTYTITASSVAPLPPAPAATAAVTNVIVNIDQESYQGKCPREFNFTCSITAGGPANVQYKWEKSDGTESEMQTLNFGEAGSKTVGGFKWTVEESGTYWAQVHVYSPNEYISRKRNFTVNCSPMQACSFKGRWEVAFGWGGHIDMSESGGTYPYNNGKLSGSVTGNIFKGIWQEDHRPGRPYDWGQVEFKMSEDCSRMSIRWSFGNEPLPDRWSESASRVQ